MGKRELRVRQIRERDAKVFYRHRDHQRIYHEARSPGLLFYLQLDGLQDAVLTQPVLEGIFPDEADEEENSVRSDNIRGHEEQKRPSELLHEVHQENVQIHAPRKRDPREDHLHTHQGEVTVPSVFLDQVADDSLCFLKKRLAVCLPEYNYDSKH